MRSKIKRLSTFFILSLSLGIFLIPVAEASIVTFEFTGILDSVYDDYNNFYPEVGVGDQLKWTVQYDTDSLDRFPDQLDRAQYSSIMVSAFEMGDFLIDSDTFSKRIDVLNDYALGVGTIDSFSITAVGDIDDVVYNLSIALKSFDLSFLDSDRPPSEVLNLSFVNPSDNVFSASLRYSDDPNSSFSGYVTSMRKIETSAVPEPTTLMLFGSGLVGFFVRRKIRD